MAAESCKSRKNKKKSLMCRSRRLGLYNNQQSERTYRIRVIVTKGNVELKQKFLFRMEWETITVEEEVSKIVRSVIV